MDMIAMPGCKSIVVGTRWANSCPGCMDRLKECYSHVVGSSFLAGKTAWALSGRLTTESIDYCMLVNEWAWLGSRVCLLKLDWVQFWSQSLERNGMFSSEKNSGFKGILRPLKFIWFSYYSSHS